MKLRPLAAAPAASALLSVMLAALAAGSPALAQQAEGVGEQDGGIVVSGVRERDEEIEEFARDLTTVVQTSPIAMYEPGDYCPGVVGLSPEANAAIAARMRQVAQASNLKPAGPGCRTSALVMFVDRGDAAIKRFRRQHPEYFSDLTGEDIMFQGLDTPVAAWKLVARLDRDGNPILVDGQTGAQIVTSYIGGSRLESMSRLVIAMSVLVIEKSAVRGLTMQQIADYALMRSVSEADPRKIGDRVAPTILKVVDTPEGEATPLSLTDWDLAYVKARYSRHRLNYGGRQLAEIRARMARDLDAVAPDGD